MPRQAVLVANSVSYSEPRQSITVAVLRRTIDKLAQILQGLPDAYKFQVVTLLDKQPTEVRRKIESSSSKARASNDLFLFYYFGHGSLSSDLELQFLHPGRAKNAYEILKLTSVENIVRDSDVQKSIFILDCCYAGAQTRNFRNNLTGEHCRLASTTPSARAYVTSGTTEDPIGIFSLSIIDGLSSEKACRSAVDNSITAESLFNYAKGQTCSLTENIQNPTIQGNLSEVLLEYQQVPDVYPGFSTWADDKTAYSKLLAICRTLASSNFTDMMSLYEAVLLEYPIAFQTLHKKADGTFAYYPVKPNVVSRYVRLLRALNLVDDSALKLLPAGRALAVNWNSSYNKLLLEGIDMYLEKRGLTREVVESSLRQLLSNRVVPSKREIFDYLVLSGHKLPKDELGIVLDLLGYIKAIRMTVDRAYFPW